MPMMKLSMITWVMIILLAAILGYSVFNMVSEGFKEVVDECEEEEKDPNGQCPEGFREGKTTATNTVARSQADCKKGFIFVKDQGCKEIIYSGASKKIVK